jgi:transcriptional regulator with XRE-family HTH domain
MKRDKVGPATQIKSEKNIFGILLHDFREERKITQLYLAVNVGRVPSDISRWEKGIRKSLPDRDTVIAIADALELSVPDKNRLLQAAGYEIPISDMGVDLANPAIMKIVDVLASTEMPPDRQRAFEKDILDFVEIWKKYQDLGGNPEEMEQEKGYKDLLDKEFSNFIDGFRMRLSHALGKNCKHQGHFQEAI